MKTMLRTATFAALLCMSQGSTAGGAIPINSTFGIGWTPIDWSNPADQITESLGASGRASGKIIGIALRDHLNTLTGQISSDYVILAFSDNDWAYARYTGIAATFDAATNTASFSGPLEVYAGEGKFAGASGSLTIHSTILFSLPVGTLDIKGVIRTAD